MGNCDVVRGEVGHFGRLLHFFLRRACSDLASCVVTPAEDLARMRHEADVAPAAVDLLHWLRHFGHSRRPVAVATLKAQLAVAKGVQHAVCIDCKADAEAGSDACENDASG